MIIIRTITQMSYTIEQTVSKTKNVGTWKVNKELATKSTKNFILVPQMLSCLCIKYIAFVTRRIAEMLRKW